MRLVKRFHLSRRAMLRGAVGSTAVALALPTLEAMLDSHGEAYAAGDPLPRRFVTWFFGNGVALNDPNDGKSGLRWTPATQGPDWELTPQLAPLANVKQYCSVLSGFDIAAAAQHRRGHHDGVAGFFSGWPFIEVPATNAEFASKFGGPSIDQVVAQAVGQRTFLPSIQLAVSKRVIKGEGPTLQHLSHKGPDQPLPAIFNPQEAWEKLFASFTPPDDPAKPQRLNALDAVREDALRLKQKVGKADQLRLEAHLESVAQIRKQIETLAPECMLPMQPVETNSDSDGKEPLEEVNRVMSDLLVLAFTCDITRVASYLFSGSVCYTVFHMLGHTMGHHDMTHDGSQNEGVDQATIFTMNQFAYLLEQLAAQPEGAGNLLDNCCILLGSDASSGLTHSVFDQPCVVAGRGGGALVHPGVHYRSPDRENSADILLSCLKVFVPDATEVGGDIGKSTTPCQAILA